MEMTREQYITECNGVIQDHRDNKGLFIIYIRKWRPKFAIKPTEEQFAEFKSLLRIFPNLTEAAYLRLRESKGLPALQRDETGDCDELRAFRTVRSIHRSNSSPIVGCVVGFKEDGVTKIGWSLCNTAAGDKMNRPIGIRRAIQRAKPLAETQQDIQKARDVLGELKKARQSFSGTMAMATVLQRANEEMPMPHTCIAYMERAVHRVTTQPQT